MSRRRRFQVREITLDMSSSMANIARRCFPAAKLVVDRFHVQQLASKAVQEMRIKARWEAIDQESIEISYAKARGIKHTPPLYHNGDSRKQLLARSRYLLFKKESSWTPSQQVRAAILFKEYPPIKQAYYLSQQLALIYHQSKTADGALMRLARWYDQVDRTGFLSFGTVARTIQMHYKEIVNFFHNRSTNAASESFNAKLKAFRAQLRGVRDIPFFLFRVCQIYA